MKALTTVLTSALWSSVATSAATSMTITEIRREDAVDGLRKMEASGFLKRLPVGNNKRILRAQKQQQQQRQRRIEKQQRRRTQSNKQGNRRLPKADKAAKAGKQQGATIPAPQDVVTERNGQNTATLRSNGYHDTIATTTQDVISNSHNSANAAADGVAYPDQYHDTIASTTQDVINNNNAPDDTEAVAYPDQYHDTIASTTQDVISNSNEATVTYPDEYHNTISSTAHSVVNGAAAPAANQQAPAYNDDWNDQFFMYEGEAWDNTNTDDHYYGDDHYTSHHDSHHYYHDTSALRGKGKGKGAKAAKHAKHTKRAKGKGGGYSYSYHGNGDGGGHGGGGGGGTVGGGSSGGSGGGVGGIGGGVNTDDFFGGNNNNDGDATTSELIYLSQVFMDTRFVQEPLSADGPLAPGTTSLYIDVPLWDLMQVDVSSLLGIVQGTCTRTDPNFDNDMYVGHGVCDFTFELLDGAVVIASFTTSGAVFNNATAVMPITAGIGELNGLTGDVFVTPARLIAGEGGAAANVVEDLTRDFLQAPADGYIVEVLFYADDPIDFLGDDRLIVLVDDDNMATTEMMESASRVSCLSNEQQEFCDCASDCVDPNTQDRCMCAEAQSASCCGTLQ